MTSLQINELEVTTTDLEPEVDVRGAGGNDFVNSFLGGFVGSFVGSVVGSVITRPNNNGCCKKDNHCRT